MHTLYIFNIENFRMEFKMIDIRYRNFIPYIIPYNMRSKKWLLDGLLFMYKDISHLFQINFIIFLFSFFLNTLH